MKDWLITLRFVEKTENNLGGPTETVAVTYRIDTPASAMFKPTRDDAIAQAASRAGRRFGKIHILDVTVEEDARPEA